MGTWARPAVLSAEKSLEEARHAWLNQRNSEVQALLNEYETERRIDALENQSAQEIIRLCGLTHVDPKDVRGLFNPENPNALSPDDCFIRREASGCQSGAPQAECYKGEIGTAAMAIIGAQKNVEIATETAEAAEGRYDLQSLFCSEKQVRLEEDLSAIDKHEERMRKLREKRMVASAFGSFLSGATAMVTSNPVGAISAMTDLATQGYQANMEEAEAAFQANMQKRSIEEDITACFHEADMMKFGIDNEYLAVERAIIDVENALLSIANMKSRVRQFLYEGDAAVERERRRTIPSLAHHYWLDEKVSRFESDFAWAQRLTYLAMLAVEYEFQQSLGLRDSILSARHPSALFDVVRVLEQEQAGRTLNGRRPEASTLVLSLRDDILALAPRSSAQAGERDWSPAVRFGELLKSPDFAVYDNDGRYLGQGIPFSIEEQGALELRCAERLWRLSATIQGDLLDVSAPGAPVFVLKRNTFLSQWCHEKGDQSPYQVGSVRPSAQLFHPNGNPGGEKETESYTSGMLYPWFNVPRSEFYQESFREGASEELAGRGLYGQYILLFPEAGLLEWTQDGSVPFPLDRVEDVLIRFDLLSVDDLFGL